MNNILRHFQIQNHINGFAVIKKNLLRPLNTELSMHCCQKFASENGYFYAKEFIVSEQALQDRGPKKTIYDYLNYAYLNTQLKQSNQIFENSKAQMDAEILLPYLYSQCGVKSAFYAPVILKDDDDKYDRHFLLSNDLEEKKSTVAKNYYSFLLRNRLINRISPCFNKGYATTEQDFFSKSGLSELISMRLVDAISCNYDRHINNFMIYFDENYKISNISVFDNESSGEYFLDYLSSRHAKSWRVCDNRNDLGYNYMTGGDLIKELKTDENLPEVFNIPSFVEKVTSIDLQKTSEEIEEETQGYKINPEYLDFLNRNILEVAEELEQ